MKRFHFSKVISTLVLCLILCLSSGCKSSTQAGFGRFLDDCLKNYGQENYLFAKSCFEDPSSHGIRMEQSAPFGSRSPAAIEEKTDRTQDILTKLNTYDTSKLSIPQQQVAILLKDKLQLDKEMLIKYPYHATTLGKGGDAVSIISSLILYEFHSSKDVEEYLNLLDKIPEYYDELYDYEKARNDAGILTSIALIQDTSEALNSFLTDKVEESIFVQSFAQRLEEIPDLAEKDKTDYLSRNEEAVRETVLPAIRHLDSTLTSKLQYSMEQDSISSYPSGSAYYEFLLKADVGTRLSPEECRTALQEIYQQAFDEKEQLYKNNPDLDSDYYSAFPTYTEPEDVMEEERQNTLVYFPKIDSVTCSFREMPDFMSDPDHTAFYIRPALDGTSDNTILFNSLLTGEEEVHGVLAHEGYPGHLYQTNYFYNTLYHPLQLYLANSGYEEGWATYAEMFQYDFLSFSNKDEEITKQLRTLYKDQALMKLCITSLADLYVNYDGHTQEELAGYLDQYDVPAESAESVYHYVIANPVDSLKYSIGYHEILDLLPPDGGKTPIQESHDTLLRFGPCPFYILSSLIGYFQQ